MFLDHGRDDLGLPTLRLGSEGPNLSFYVREVVVLRWGVRV